MVLGRTGSACSWGMLRYLMPSSNIESTLGHFYAKRFFVYYFLKIIFKTVGDLLDAKLGARYVHHGEVASTAHQIARRRLL